MARLASIFISTHNLRLIRLAVWLIAFLAAGVLLGGMAYLQVKEAIRSDAQAALEQFVRLRDNVAETFEALRQDVTAEPCSQEFHTQLRKVAYRPDGLNEFFYAPGGAVHCSVDVEIFPEPVQLGQADFVSESGTTFWVDRDITFAGLRGVSATVALRDQFALVIPKQDFEIAQPSWMEAEAVLVAPNGRWWRRGGDPLVFQDHVLSASDRSSQTAALRQMACLPDGLHCVAIRVPLANLFSAKKTAVAVLLVLAGCIASWLSQIATGFIRRHWSFEARFLRNLNTESIVLAYQPIIDLRTREVSGCEVLARWRDLDDTIVFPDRFLPIIEKHRLTEKLTHLVVQRAFEELDATLRASRPIQVNFNIFPCDLDAAGLIEAFAVFRQARDRFVVALEIIESDAVDIDTAQAEIEALRRAGFLVYIDDFGTGYSTLKQLAELEVDGVKLDRSFAMAPEGSLMSEMLAYAICMVHAAGRSIVVEGVETEERLAQLRAGEARIEYVQGYFIARPLDIGRFAGFLRSWKLESAETRSRAA